MPLPVSDPRLKPVATKVEAGERLSQHDALLLFDSADLLGIGAMADLANRRLNGNRVFFSANQHLNPTNVCILRKTCVFCSFARTPREAGAYTRSLDEVFEEAEAAREHPTREFHIVGGLHPKLRLDYYLEMFRGLRERHPDVHIKALTAVEVAHLARIEGMTTGDVLRAMKEAGVDTLPGGGAEVFGPAVRHAIADRKLMAEDWLRVHREAHELGIPTNCTMLYGHVESHGDRVEHLAMLRQLEDDAPGFLTYIPLAYHPDHNVLGERLARQGTATTGFDDLKNIAVGRLFLDNIPHVKTHWPMVTPFLHTPMMLSYGELVRFIKGAGKEPVERDAFYRALRTFEPDDSIFGPDAGVGWSSAEFLQAVGAGRA
jgi:aminodeoxyfutalosine synthase